MEQAKILNVIGPGLRRQREQLGWTQNQVVARCQVLGFDLTRGTLAKIESRVRAVSDHEIPYLARALGCSIETLFPKHPQSIIRKPRNAGGTRRTL